MTLLASHPWKLKYTPEDGDLVRIFYNPVLEDAVRYDRLTGYFGAEALTLASRGIEGLIRNNGRMRLVIGCTLAPPEIEAIEKGSQLRDLAEKHLASVPLQPQNDSHKSALELLAWMIGRGILEVKVAVPCDANRRPIPADGIFHEKAGIVEDKLGDRLAWNGSLNETAAGWRYNWESINIFTSWGQEPNRVKEEEENFARIWSNQSKRVITLDVPSAVREDLMRFMPADDHPARLKKVSEEEKEVPEPEKPSPAPDSVDLRRAVWNFIRTAPRLPGGGERVGETTSAITPWPHQSRAFQRLYGQWPPRLLIADEVGLGKTIQAGMYLRQAWLAGIAKRVLILAPKAILKQWQIELREKFNLSVPIYDGGELSWYPSPALQGKNVRKVSRGEWHKEPIVIVSSQLMRRVDRAPEILEQSDPWDLIFLDEAHHARRQSAGAAKEGPPNTLLRLMQRLKDRTQGLILLTATPMQVHPVEVWDLLNLLGLPREWNEKAFLDFFETVEHPNPSHESFERAARLFQSLEGQCGRLPDADALRFGGLQSRLKTNRVLRAMRDGSAIPRRQLEAEERGAAIRIMRVGSPVRKLVSRHTRDLLRRYYKAGKLTTPISDRDVSDRFIVLTDEERRIYHEVEDYISSTYNNASEKEKSAVGFVMTNYRRRLASSFHALGHTLQAHLQAVEGGRGLVPPISNDDLTEEDEAADGMDEEKASELQRQALVLVEKGDIERLLSDIRRLPPDTKALVLKKELDTLRENGYRQVMVFSQFTDTMDFLRDELRKAGGYRIMCFSGRGGEIMGIDGTWRIISRDEIKRRFKGGEADVLLCSEAAAEGLNFQFCGAMINYDMPWNPMKVEQRIGRIDRLGQRHPIIRIINLHYEDTVETDVYRALRDRIGLFQSVIGRLQPILSQLPGQITRTVLTGAARRGDDRALLVHGLEEEVVRVSASGFDIDAITEEDLEMPPIPSSPLTLEDLDLVVQRKDILPPGNVATGMGIREYAWSEPGMASPIRVTTDSGYYDDHSDSMELWSPGSPVFPAPKGVDGSEGAPLPTATLKDYLLHYR